jgi:hypothetical protein
MPSTPAATGPRRRRALAPPTGRLSARPGWSGRRSVGASARAASLGGDPCILYQKWDTTVRAAARLASRITLAAGVPGSADTRLVAQCARA